MKRGITLGMILAISAICLWGVKAMVRHLFAIDAYSCRFDTTISDFHKNEIFDFVNTNKYFRMASLDDLFLKVKERFKIIESIKAYQSASGVLRLDIKTVQPKFVLNGDYVMSQEGELFGKKVFSADVLSSCKQVTIEQLDLPDLYVPGNTGELPVFCKEIMRRLPDESFDEYGIVLESEIKNYMHDKSNKKFSILFNGLYVPDEKILVACGQLKNKLERENRFNFKRVKRWYADVRFKNQIVLCKKKRGR